MVKIINPNKLNRKQIPVFDISDYYIFVEITEIEKNSLIRYLQKDNSENKYFAFFIKDFINMITNLLVGIRLLSHHYLSNVNVLLRSQTETVVDLFWGYSIFLENSLLGVKLAKRFYQISADKFFDISPKFENALTNDPFFISVRNKIDLAAKRESVKNKKVIDLYNENDKPELIALQKKDWHAIPELISNRKELEFAKKADRAIKLVSNMSNLKNAPYSTNWKLLNLFSHPSAIQYINEDEDVLKAFYKKNLDISLGIVHDSFNLAYHYLKQTPPAKILEIRNKFHWFSL
jgi:hypothetical protein